MTFPYGLLGSASSLLQGGGQRASQGRGDEAQRRGTTRGGREMDPPKDFIILSEFSEQVGPVPVVGLQG